MEIEHTFFLANACYRTVERTFSGISLSGWCSDAIAMS